jgi:hypothetical protein
MYRLIVLGIIVLSFCVVSFGGNDVDSSTYTFKTVSASSFSEVIESNEVVDVNTIKWPSSMGDNDNSGNNI